MRLSSTGSGFQTEPALDGRVRSAAFSSASRKAMPPGVVLGRTRSPAHQLHICSRREVALSSAVIQVMMGLQSAQMLEVRFMPVGTGGASAPSKFHTESCVIGVAGEKHVSCLVVFTDSRLVSRYGLPVDGQSQAIQVVPGAGRRGTCAGSGDRGLRWKEPRKPGDWTWTASVHHIRRGHDGTCWIAKLQRSASDQGSRSPSPLTSVVTADRSTAR
jgi:hypothetical protein